MCVCLREEGSKMSPVFRGEGAAEIGRLEAWLLPVGMGSLFNKRVQRPEGHVREMLLPWFY